MSTESGLEVKIRVTVKFWDFYFWVIAWNVTVQIHAWYCSVDPWGTNIHIKEWYHGPGACPKDFSPWDENKDALSEASDFSMVQQVWCEDTQAIRGVWVYLPCSWL